MNLIISEKLESYAKKNTNKVAIIGIRSALRSFPAFFYDKNYSFWPERKINESIFKIVRAILIIYSNSRDLLSSDAIEEVRLLSDSVRNAIEPESTIEQRDMFYSILRVVYPFIDSVHGALVSYHEDCPKKVCSHTLTAIRSSAESSKIYGLYSKILEFSEIDIDNLNSITEQELLYSPLWYEKELESQYVGFKEGLMSLKSNTEENCGKNYLVDFVSDFYERVITGSLNENFLLDGVKKLNTYIENNGMPKKYFISHASEDKEPFVKLLVEKMRGQGVLVWYDEYSLKVGESLTESINRGISECDYGVVVLSHDFFKKNWTKLEYNSLNTLDVSQQGGVILPIWHNVCFDDVAKYNLSLADKAALKSSEDIDILVKKLIN